MGQVSFATPARRHRPFRVCLAYGPYDGPVAGIWHDVFPPLSILSLAAYLRRARPDIEISVVDGLRHGPTETARRAIAADADLYGVSFLTFNASSSYRLVDTIKGARPAARVVVGGEHATSLERDPFQRSGADYVVHGEGEETLVELVDALAWGGDVSRIPGLLFRWGDEVVRTPERPLLKSLDELPFPARDLIDFRDYSGFYVARRSPNTDFLSGRGCVVECTFCARAVWTRQKPWVRLRSPASIVAEMAELRDRFGMRELIDMADLFNPSEKWSIAVAREIAAANLDLRWQTFCRARPVTDEMAAAMSAAGCWQVHLGIESGNPRTLAGIKKEVTLDDIVAACTTFKRNGIDVVGLCMIFNAWEEEGRLVFEGARESRHTLSFLRSLLRDRLISSFTFSPAQPYPGGELYEVARRHRLVPERRYDDWGEWDHAWTSVMELPGVSARDRWSVKLLGVWTQAWAIVRSGHMTFTPALWKRGMGVFRMLALAVVDATHGALAERRRHRGARRAAEVRSEPALPRGSDVAMPDPG